MKSKLKQSMVIIGLLVIVLGAFFLFFLDPARLTPDNPKGKTSYYTMIINDEIRIKQNERYEYKLDSYNTQGHLKTLKFTSSKRLRDGAFLELFVTPLRGVTYFQEVQYTELPNRVQAIYLQE